MKMALHNLKRKEDERNYAKQTQLTNRQQNCYDTRTCACSITDSGTLQKHQNVHPKLTILKVPFGGSVQ